MQLYFLACKWFAIGVIVVIITYQMLIQGPDYYYQFVELPAVRAEVQHVPGIIFLGIRDLGQPDEPSVEVILDIPNKGSITLFHPTRRSFTGGGTIIISGIGHCASTPLLFMTPGPGKFDDLHIRTFSDVVANYDRIYQRVREKYCLLQDARGAVPNQP